MRRHIKHKGIITSVANFFIFSLSCVHICILYHLPCAVPSTMYHLPCDRWI